MFKTSGCSYEIKTRVVKGIELCKLMSNSKMKMIHF